MRRTQSRDMRTESGMELGSGLHRALSPSEAWSWEVGCIGRSAQVRWRAKPGIELAWRKEESRVHIRRI